MRRRFLQALFFVTLPLAACSGTNDHAPPATGCNDPSCATGTTITGHDAAVDALADATLDSTHPDAATDSASADTPEAIAVPVNCDDVPTGNIAIIDGNVADPVWVGPEAVGGPVPGTFDVVLSKPDTVVVRATSSVDKVVLLYAFSTASMGVPMTPGLYTGAKRYGSEPAGSPGFNLEVNGTTCNLTASFTIVDIAVDAFDSHLVRFSAKFSRTCAEGGEAMPGCIRYAEPSTSDAGTAD